MISRFSTVMGTPASPPPPLFTPLNKMSVHASSKCVFGVIFWSLSKCVGTFIQKLMPRPYETWSFFTLHFCVSHNALSKFKILPDFQTPQLKRPLDIREAASVWRLCAFKCCVCVLSLQHILIVQRQLSVLEEELEEFRLALRQYMECACAQTGCLQSVYILFVHLCQGFTAFIFILSIFHIFVKAWLRRADRQVLWSCPNLRLKIFQLLFWH